MAPNAFCFFVFVMGCQIKQPHPLAVKIFQTILPVISDPGLQVCHAQKRCAWVLTGVGDFS